MIKRKIPFAHAKSIYDVDPTFYRKLGIKVILTDLDNTLDSIQTKTPSEKAKALKVMMEREGIRFLIVSNNTGKRVRMYAQELGVGAVCWMLKPFSFRLKSFLKREKIAKEEVLLIGDQILTDVLAGNGAKIKTLLCDPLVPEDPPWTRFNRIFERPIRRKLKERHLVKEWEELL
ncbi:MAG: HAD hydrolase-like protein [Bacilli bacterium]|nr:HAD hydrolase-like protein [Bacilli bacterium]